MSKFRRDSITHASNANSQLPDYEGEKKSREEIEKIRATLGIKGNRHERNRRERGNARG